MNGFKVVIHNIKLQRNIEVFDQNGQKVIGVTGDNAVMIEGQVRAIHARKRVDSIDKIIELLQAV